MEKDTPGVRAASMLFDRGLWFEAVVRGLVTDVGFTVEQATSAAVAASYERLAQSDAMRSRAFAATN